MPYQKIIDNTEDKLAWKGHFTHFRLRNSLGTPNIQFSYEIMEYAVAVDTDQRLDIPPKKMSPGVKRLMANVKDETVTVEGVTVTARQVAKAIAAFGKKWYDEDADTTPIPPEGP